MNRIFRILAFVLLGLSLLAQNESNSPYSRFGLSDLQSFLRLLSRQWVELA